MKIATVGAGIAGRYLARLLLQRGIFPDVNEGGITTIAAVVALNIRPQPLSCLLTRSWASKLL
jgi:hypothetical protein